MTASSVTTSAAGCKIKSIPLDLHAKPVYVESMNGNHRVVSQNRGRNWVNADLNTVFGYVAKAPLILDTQLCAIYCLVIEGPAHHRSRAKSRTQKKA